MRGLLVACGLLVLSAGASAQTLVDTRPGLMCRSARALGLLTLPDGSSRASSSRAHPGDEDMKKAGGCLDIPAGAQVAVITARKNTSIVTFDASDGRGRQTYFVPNIDFRSEGGDALGSPAAAGSFGALMAQRCPQQRWDRATASSFEGPLIEADKVLSPAEIKEENAEEARECGPMGMTCPDSVNVGFLIGHGHASAVVRAFCGVKPDTF